MMLSGEAQYHARLGFAAFTVFGDLVRTDYDALYSCTRGFCLVQQITMDL